MADSDEELSSAIEDVLAMYDIKLDKQKEEFNHVAEDYSEVISKTQKRLDDLNERAEEIFKRTGMTREQLEKYATNPKNFTKEQWESLQKVKEACEEYKKAAFERVGCDESGEKVKKEKKKEPHRFAKKKNWIPL